MSTPIDFDPSEGYPAGRDVVYACLHCGDDVRSMPTPADAWSCGCGNIRVAAHAGRVSVRDHAKLRAFTDVRDP